MNTREGPLSLADRLLKRSPHYKYHIAAVIFDNHGIISWGWNHPEKHAEAHAIERGNPRRIRGATMAVLGRKTKNGNVLLTKPCPECEKRILAAGIARVYHTFYDPSDPKNFRFQILESKLVQIVRE